MASRDSERKESRWGEDRESKRGMGLGLGLGLGSGPIYKCVVMRTRPMQLYFVGESIAAEPNRAYARGKGQARFGSDVTIGGGGLGEC